MIKHKPQLAGHRSQAQIIWEAVRAHAQAKSFMVSDIEYTSGQNPNAIKSYLKNLEKNHYIAIAHKEKINHICKRNHYIVMKAMPVLAPDFDKNGAIKEVSPHEKMWQTMRRVFIGKMFSAVELAGFSAADESVSHNQAKQFLQALSEIGYVDCVEPPQKWNRKHSPVYFFPRTKDTGVRAPHVRAKDVLDKNLDIVIPRHTSS